MNATPLAQALDDHHRQQLAAGRDADHWTCCGARYAPAHVPIREQHADPTIPNPR